MYKKLVSQYFMDDTIVLEVILEAVYQELLLNRWTIK